MIKTAKISGKEIELKKVTYKLPDALESKFELIKSIEVSSYRSKNEAVKLNLKENDLLALQFTDNTEWIGRLDDIQEIYDEKTLKNRSKGIKEDFLFDYQITQAASSRGVIKRAVIKLFTVFRPKEEKTIKKKGSKNIAKTLGEYYDEKIQPNPGLYKLDANLNVLPYKKTVSKSKKCLVLIHGTLSTTTNAFGELNNSNETWQKIVAQYGNHILALEHQTLSVSPLKNALDFLETCPKDCQFDILSHSRGGLVADILAKCDYRNDTIGFSKNELNIVEGSGSMNDMVSHKLMTKINKIAKTKRITIGKIIRVASPASGTTILSRRIDHFFNLTLNAISLAFGIQNPLYQIVKSFLLELLSQKEDPEQLAGLNSMMPESLFQKMMNASDTPVESKLYNIIGDSDIGGINFNSLKVILANLFYRVENDLVVDTNRMEHGIKRSHGFYTYLSEGSETNHFNYFSNNDSCNAIIQAIEATKEKPATIFKEHIYTEGERGILLKSFSLKGIQFRPEDITRDVVIIIPGIMGSTLANDNEEQWVDMPCINRGGIASKLNISALNVEATGIIKKFYAKLGNHLSVDYDVISLEFDWRKSLKHAAKQLSLQLADLIKNHKDINIHIVAHSMGGLVARQCMMDFKNTWNQFKTNTKNKFIMLGTPWLGSHLIMEVLTGHSKRVKQLAALDFKNNRKDLLKIFWKYPGIFELLPIEKNGKDDFEKVEFWKNLDEKVNLRHTPEVSNNTKSLREFKKFKESVIKFTDALTKNDFKNTYYICGKADETTFDYRFKNRFLSKYKRLVYKATSFGDGSVTWKTGIPKQIDSTNLYYTHTTHGDLANEPYIFKGISDLLKNGQTSKLETQAPRSRSGEVITDVYDYQEPLYNTNAVEDAIFGTKKTTKSKTEKVNVTVINGDLKTAKYPVMVGHFFMDLILSAEKALDGYLDNRLSQRLGIGYYPGKIGESEVFFNLKTKPKGAIICGLGYIDALSPFQLSKTIELATLKYALFMRDNYTLPEAKKYANGISLILMGIGYGKLPIDDSLKGIMLGISAANNYIEKANIGLKLIKNIEIINYYESIASQAYFSLNKMKNADNRISFDLTKKIEGRAGKKKKQIYANSTYDWWHNIQISSIINSNHVKGYKFFSSNGLARIEKESVHIGLDKTNELLENIAISSMWSKRLSKTLFEMLIPNVFKNIFRNQNNLTLKLDKNAAEIPWELFHDYKTDDTPAAVNSTFIRQLITENSSYHKQVGLNNNNVLIIGDPLYENDNLPELPAAKAEAKWVAAQFIKNKYRTVSLINQNASSIIMDLFDRQYKIMHFSGHGLYDIENNEIGIAIGNNICINPAMFNQMGVPEFVFINCCYSGTMNATDDRYSNNRHKLAANIGTQLIEMGVKAIIVSGWAVDDAAAKTFSETFYEKMLEGYHFGVSVQKARLKCFQIHEETNTWGAYQCYGNQFYKFDNKSNKKKNELDYIIPSQVHIDLDNLLTAIQDQKHDPEKTLKKLNHYIEKANKANLVDAKVLEKEALIYNELGITDIALQKFINLFSFANGNFSIEALEQYCVIKSQDLTIENFEKDLQEISFLTMVGKNPTRLNIIGNAYKFASTLMTEVDDSESHLLKAFDFYKTTHEISDDEFDAQSLKALSNMIFIGKILENLGKGDLISHLKKCKSFEGIEDLNKHLANFYYELERRDKSNLTILELLGFAEASYGLLLFILNNRTDFDIINQFKYLFNQLYSPRLIGIKLKQIKFLLHYFKDEIIVQQLHTIEDELNNLIK